MNKYLPNLLLVLVVSANIFFMGRYIRNNGLGMFLSTTGMVFLVLGLVIFIFFLSIDPGYGWSKTIDLTKNYIMIFTSMAIGIAGVVLIVVGQQMNELHVQSLNNDKRCRQLISGNAAEILKKDWYRLRNQKSRAGISVYLFQKKSDRNSYKIIGTIDDAKSSPAIKDLTITSMFIEQPIVANKNDSTCPGVFEKNISINLDRNQELNEQVQFDLVFTITAESGTERSGSGKILFTLTSEADESWKKQETGTPAEPQAFSRHPGLNVFLSLNGQFTQPHL